MKKTTFLYKKLYFSIGLVLISFLFNNKINAQTVLISPTGDGGFETGATFAANGWIEVNNSTTKDWYIGTGQSGYTGNRCAFIGNSSTTVGTNSSARKIHVYRSITIPAGATNINLSFKYKQAVADYSSSTYYDYISVYTDNTAPTNGNTPAGTLLFGPYPNSNVTSFTTQNATLSNSLAGTTTNLIFTFTCDNTNPKGFGAIDDVSLTYTPLVSSPPTITGLGSTNGCAGSSITINGTNLSSASSVKIGGTAVTTITFNSATQIVATIDTGTTGTVTVTTAGGTATSATTFTINTLPTANAGSTLTDICQGGTTVALGGSYGGAATSAVWSTTSGGTFTNNTGTTPNTTTWTPPAGFSGTATLNLTTTGGSCTGATASKNQVVNATPTVTIGSALTAICQGGTTVALGGSYGGSATSAVWSDGVIGGVFINNTGTTPNTTTWTPPAGYTGTATLILTSSGGSCGTVFSSKTQVVNQAPTANAGIALITICQGGTTVALGGTYGGSATGATWSTTSGGTFANNTGTTPSTTTWTPPAGFTGTATLVLTTAGGSCTATTVSKIQLVSGPTASAGSALTTICQGSSTVALGGSYGGSATSAVWSDGGVGGTFTNNTGSTPGTTIWTPPGAYTGTATLTLSTSGGSCGATTASKTQVVNAQPTTANAGTDQTLAACATTATLAGNTATIGSGNWSLVSGTATIITPSSPTSGITGLTIGGSATLRWSISNGGCTVSSDDVNITTVSGAGCLTYCAPTYSSGSGNGNTITNVTLGTLNNTSGASSSPYYTFYNATTIPNLVQSTTVSVTISFGSDSNQYAAVWLDFNQNGTFETSEGFITGLTNGVGPITINIPIPAGAITGNTRMRVRGADDSALTTSQACGVSNSSKGETEDYIVNIASPTPLTNGPGGVMSNLQLWFRSDLLNGTPSVADGTSVTTWNTQARGTNASVNTIGQEPKYYNNATKNINFNAVVDFTNDYNNAPFEIDYTYKPQQYLQGTSGYYTQDMFVVILPDTPIASTNESMDIFCGDSPDAAFDARDGSGIGFGKYTVRTDDEVISYSISTTSTTTVPENQRGYGVAQTGTTITYNNVGIINTRNNSGVTGQELYYNALNISNKEVGIPKFTNLNDTRYWIGRSQAFRGSLDGRVGEIITYSSRVSDIQRSNVQSYLAIKYGITLGVNGTSLNYTNSDGNIIWNINTGVTANDVFNYDIAGIGRDDLSKLTQKQSKTVNTADDITIGLIDIAATNTANTNTFDTDKKFLVWGNNHGTLNAQPEVKVNMSSGITPALTSEVTFISVGRTWKVVETGGNVPTAKVSIPTTMLSATLTPPGDYLMFISNTPNFDPTAEYRIMTVNGSNLETTYDFDGTKYITFGFAPEKTFVRSIAFDGANDYLDAGKVLNLNTSFTVSSWIKRNGSNQTILSKRDNAFTTGYDLSINSAGNAEMSWMNGTKQTITSTVVIPSGIWHNVAVSYNGTTAKLYIDGVLDVSKAMSTVPANTQSFLIAAADGVNTTSYFNGNIDEVRVWNVALTDKQLRYVMNQEILSNGLATNGSIIPNTITLNEISPIPWSNLSAYYPMSTYTYTNAKDISNNHYTAALRNLTTVDLQTAPLPYESATDGPWQTPTTWLNSNVQDIPNDLSIVDGTPVNWNIVKTTNNVSSEGNKTVLGLMVNSQTLTASTDSKIEVTNYLKLDGKIDLVEMSQLVQTLDCDLDVTSKGSIERDQQGQANIYNYNYWCSPVSPITPIAPFANNTDYTVTGIMKDGLNAIPREIKWIAGYDGIAGDATTSMSIARYWLYTFDNKVNDYAKWAKITETTALRVGQGYTMKGSGGTGTQNYTFVGKPNNGLINTTNSVGADQLLLTGNPYPSALDAKKFIEDNTGSSDGTLYFWEHYATNTTHVLKEYQGGYATLNLVGGVASGSIPSSADLGISGLGTSSKGDPKQFIPVGQGFFINGSGTGGTIIFKNSQRAFFKENDEGNSNSMYKKRPGISKTAYRDHWHDNSNDTIQKKDTYKRVRLGFNSNNNYHRQVLLGFMNEKATSGMDYGYDGLSLDDFPNDMYLLNGENQLVIQGEGSFNPDNSYPIGVKADVAGKISFTIDALENFDAEQKVYIYDDETKTYNEIQNNAFEVEVPIGENNTRFSLRFKDKTLADKTLSVEENTKTSDIKITHIQNENRLQINNNVLDTTIEKVTLFNILGQSVATWNVANKEQQNIQLPIKKMSSGIYVVKLKTTSGELSKKIIVK